MADSPSQQDSPEAYINQSFADLNAQLNNRYTTARQRDAFKTYALRHVFLEMPLSGTRGYFDLRSYRRNADYVDIRLEGTARHFMDTAADQL